MGPRPWNPASELKAALERGDLDFAIALAEELRIERGRAIDLSTAARFLPLVVHGRPTEYDAWALRWLRRWAVEDSGATIDRAADVAAALADLPAEPTRLDAPLSDVTWAG